MLQNSTENVNSHQLDDRIQHINMVRVRYLMNGYKSHEPSQKRNECTLRVGTSCRKACHVKTGFSRSESFEGADEKLGGAGPLASSMDGRVLRIIQTISFKQHLPTVAKVAIEDE